MSLKSPQKFYELKNFLQDNLGLPSNLKRRKILIDQMEILSDQKIDCQGCAGTCCTKISNSMQITPLEAFEIALYLDELGEDDLINIKNILIKNIEDFRLNHQVYFLRKSYTCPFFGVEKEGGGACKIPKQYKPYGCLGFNPTKLDAQAVACHSSLNLLKEREALYFEYENIANSFLKNKLQLFFEKLPIPSAVLEVLEKIASTL